MQQSLHRNCRVQQSGRSMFPIAIILFKFCKLKMAVIVFFFFCALSNYFAREIYSSEPKNPKQQFWLYSFLFKFIYITCNPIFFWVITTVLARCPHQILNSMQWHSQYELSSEFSPSSHQCCQEVSSRAKAMGKLTGLHSEDSFSFLGKLNFRLKMLMTSLIVIASCL